MSKKIEETDVVRLKSTRGLGTTWTVEQVLVCERTKERYLRNVSFSGGSFSGMILPEKLFKLVEDDDL